MAPTKRKSTTLDSPSPTSSSPPPLSSTLSNPPSKRNKQTTTTSSLPQDLPTSKLDSDSNPYWDLSSTRRITLSEYRGKKMLSIREYYQKDSQWLPGKKGITMTLEQFGVLIGVLPQIERVLVEQGGDEKIGRPRYDHDHDNGEGGRDEDGEQEREQEEKVVVRRREKERKERKSNIEATSDEDEDED